MNTLPRILELVPTLQRRGIERVVTAIATGLHGSDYEIDVCCQKETGPFASILSKNGIEVSCLSERGPRDYKAALRLWKLIRLKRYDIVHWHSPTAVGYQIPIAHAAGAKHIICTFHGMPGSPAPPAVCAKRAATRICTKLLSRRIDWLYGCSQAVMKSQVACGWSDCRSSIIYNGVDLSVNAGKVQSSVAKKRLKLPPDAVVIGCVGALSEGKGQRYLIQALPLVRKKLPAACAVLVGAGSSCIALRELARKCACQDEVFFVGEQDNIASVLSTMDVFALASTGEGLPLALIEAMACGVPVVASAVGGVPEVIRDGQNGVLVPPCKPGALADAIVRVCSDRSLAESLRTQGLETVATRFQASRMVKEVSDLYRTVLGSSEDSRV